MLWRQEGYFITEGVSVYFDRAGYASVKGEAGIAGTVTDRWPGSPTGPDNQISLESDGTSVAGIAAPRAR